MNFNTYIPPLDLFRYETSGFVALVASKDEGGVVPLLRRGLWSTDDLGALPAGQTFRITLVKRNVCVHQPMLLRWEAEAS